MKVSQNNCVGLAYAGHRARLVEGIAKCLLFVILTSLGFLTALPIHAQLASTSASTTSGTGLQSGFSNGVPQEVGASTLPNLSLPKTLVSGVNNIAGRVGVAQTSPDNFTLFDSSIRLRLLGGITPHDQLVGPGNNVLSNWCSWGVQASINGTWVPLLPASNRLSTLGANATNASVVRTMQVGSGDYSGILKVVYEALASGRLKWDLQFNALSLGRYRLVYAWDNLTVMSTINSLSRQFLVQYPSGTYALSWGDIPSSYGATAGLADGQFTLVIDLGTESPGSVVDIDPSIVSSNLWSNATGDTFQRHVFYDPTYGNYWVFYNNATAHGLPQVEYSYSHDGTRWTRVNSLPPGWPVCQQCVANNLTLFNSGSTVILTEGEFAEYYLGCGCSNNLSVSVIYSVGTLTAGGISWGATQSWYTDQLLCPSATLCEFGIQDVSVTVSSTGQPAMSFNEYYFVASTSQCVSYFYATYGNRTPLKVDTDSSCNTPESNPSFRPDEMRSAIVPSNSQGTVLAVYQKYVSGQSGWSKELFYLTFNSATNTGPQLLDGSVLDSGEFSMVSDSNYNVHLLYRSNVDGNTTYAYLSPASGSSWAFSRNIFGVSVSSPTITVDSSTNDVYGFGIQGSSIVMKEKMANWADSSNAYPITGRTSSPTLLGSNFASASLANSTQLELVWTEKSGNNDNYTVVFASIPIGTVWSPYSDPKDPWDGNGLAPYGQYFANLGESVSPFTGMLSVEQTDMNIPGRGLTLEFTRVYVEPYSFLNGPYNYENYPWAPLGDGWQFNFPWMNDISHPSFIHLWNGEGYRIPSSFWNGASGAFENHQGENFRMVRNSTGIYLFDAHGDAYIFDQSHLNRLTRIVDPVGNQIQFSYNTNNQIMTVADTVTRSFQFCYSGGLLSSINETSASCGSQGQSRAILFKYSGADLVQVYDPAGRITSYTYNSFTGLSVTPWLLSEITYPTGWYSNYTFRPYAIGAEASSYRVTKQYVGTGIVSNPRVREFDYAYTGGAGDQVNNSTVTAYDGSGANPISYTFYAFSFAGVTWNVTDGSHTFVRGEQQRFGVHGEVPREIVLISTTQGYTNYYRYDLWGNMIYSRQVINPSTNWYHETFNSYYNDGLQPGFRAFQETFSQNQGNATDNPWYGGTGDWTVQNGLYNGTYVSGGLLSTFSWSNSSSADISLQARVYLVRQVNSTAQAGIFVHYPGSTIEKWSLYLATQPGTNIAIMQDDGTTQGNSTTCNFTRLLSTWYTFNLTFRGNSGTGWIKSDQQPGSCRTSISINYSPVAHSTGFGVLTGGFSALFDNITVATVSPSLTTTGFTGSFYPNGAPNPNIHDALAGTAELQNGTGSAPIESYESYTSSGQLSQTRRLYSPPTGTQWLTTSRTYDGYGNPATTTDSLGNNTYYTYSSNYLNAYLTNQTQVLKPGGTQITRLYTYNFGLGAVNSTRDPNGYTTTYQYDVLGRITKTTLVTGDYTAYAYNDIGNYVDITNEMGWKTRQIYDGLGRLVVTERFLNGSPYSNQTTTYNWQDRATSIRDATSNITYYGYDGLGRLVNTIYPDGTSILHSYNDIGSWSLVKNQNGDYSCRISDRLGRLLTVIEVSDPQCNRILLAGLYYVTNYYYDEVGNLRSVVASNGQTTTYTYDNLNRLVQISFADKTARSYSYDNNGNMIIGTDQNKILTTYLYDSLNRLTNITYHGTRTERDNYTYDNDGNIIQTKSLNASINTVLDPRARLTNEYYYINPTICSSCSGGGGGGGSVAEGTLITLANRTAVPVQSLQSGMQLLSYNVTTHYYAVSTITRMVVVYTHNMLIIKTQDPLPLRVDNATAQKLYMMKSDGTIGWFSVTELRVGDYLYNAIELKWTRVTDIGYASGGIYKMYDIYTTAPFDYIADNYLDPPKIPTGPSTPSGNLAASYSIYYTYSGETLAGIGYAGTFGVGYYYDGLGRVLNVTQSLPSYFAAFTYNKNDQVTQIKYGNGLTTTYSYDNLGRPTQITLGNPKKPLLALGYSYNATGTVASVVGSANGAQVNEQYRYDPLQRLVNATLVSGTSTTRLWYQYEAVGNRVAQGLNTTSTTLPSYKWITTRFGYNPANDELLNYTTSGNTVRYGYDANGNLVSRNVTGTSQWTYKWDVPGRLLVASNNTAVQGYYAYDALGRRVESKEGSTGNFYAYLGTQTLYEQTLTGIVNDYVMADGMLIAKSTSAPASVTYYHPDGLGSTRLTTDSTGKVLFADNYQPYGQDNGTPTGSETYKFTGKPVSQTTGLYYEYQRWYDPSVGRFISQDPVAGRLSDPQSLNPYVYVEDTPTSATDPTGMADCGWSPLSWGGCIENAGVAAWNGLTTAGSDIENGWNGLPPWAKAAIITAAIVTVIVAVAVGTGGIGVLAAPEIASGLGGADFATGLGIGGLSIGSVGLGDLGLGVGTVGLGLLGLDALSGSFATSASGGGTPGSGGVGLGSTGNGGIGPIAPAPGVGGLGRSIGISQIGVGGGPRPGEPPRTPDEDPSYRREKIPTEPPGGASRPWGALCAGAGLAGLTVGFWARVETADTRIDYPIEGGAIGLTLCALAYLNYG